MHPTESDAMQVPLFESHGWTQWPRYPEWSAQFMRILGATQNGAGTISECFLAASRITPGDPGSWYEQWRRMGDASAQYAQAALGAGHALTARAAYLRASNYHRVSEQFLMATDPRRSLALAQTQQHAQAGVALMSPAGENVVIALDDGGTLDACFLAPACGPRRWPVVIGFGGLDGCKEELIQRLAQDALARGLALLLVDMPGQGSGLRERGLVNRPDSELAVARCIDYLEQRGDVDAARIALYGASLGGIAAARAASVERRLAAVVSDSLVFDLHAGLAQRLAAGHADWDFLEWVFGCPTPAAVVEKSRQYSMAGFLAQVACPYLIVQGAHDFLGLQTALDAFAFCQAHGVPASLKVFDAGQTGAAHCQADNPTLGQEFICDWLADQLASSHLLPSAKESHESEPV